MIDTSTIPPSNYVRELHHHNGATQDIIDVILLADKKNDTRFCEFAKQFEPTKAGLKKLWKFTKYQIKYKTDAFGTQDIKFPAALWKARKGDCKSKTLFINQVLKCLGIDYITRFVKFDKGDYTHVYSIAILNGQKIPIDSVYDYFNKEAPFFKELDFMTKISTIEGHNISRAIGEDLYYQAQEAAQKRYQEIQQRKQYVQPEPPINFGNLTEGAALAELLIRKLKIIGAMKDEQKATTEKGIALVRNSIRNGKVGGVIPDELQGVAARINHYLSLNGSAVGHGARGRLLDFLKLKARNETNSIGSIPFTECLLVNLYYEGNGGAGTQIDPFRYQETVQGTSLLTMMSCNPISLNYINSISNNVYFFYGRKTNFRTKLVNSGQQFNQIINAFIAANPNLISHVGNGNYRFQTQAAYDTLLEQLKQKMPVLSNWANDLFRADNTRPDGTVGTGVLYNFVPYLTQIAAINPGNFPSVVQTKMVFQQQYIDSCVNFSSISRTIFEDMSENGILFDNGGETPERILSALLKSYNPNIGEPLSATAVTLIIGIVSAVLSAATTVIVNAMNNGADAAKTIDNSLDQTNPFKNQSPSTIPNTDDFTPLAPSGGGSGGGSNSGGGGSGGSGGGNNNSKKKGSVLPWVLAGLGLYTYNNRKKK